MKAIADLFYFIKEKKIDAFLNELDNNLFFDKRDGEGFTLLHRAGQSRNYRFAEALLAKGVNPNVRARWNWTPLHEAVSHGNYKTTEVLLKYGAKIEIFSDWAETPLIVALHSRRPNIIRLLLEYKANPLEKDKLGRNALHILTTTFKPPLEREILLFNIFLEAGVRVESSFQCITPLQQAMNYKRYDLAKILLNHGSKPNEVNREGFRPLHQAAMAKQYDLVELLIARGADVNKFTRDSDSWTALHHAVRNKDSKLCQILLEHGADITLKDGSGLTECDYS